MDDKKLAELFAAIRSGDKAAFTAFYEAYKKPVYTVLWRIVGSRETAEDLTHDLFLKILADPPALSVKKPRAYVFAMARNLALNALRSMEYAKRESAPEGRTADFSGVDLRLDLSAAFSRLSSNQRQILALRLNAGLTFREVSKVMELSLPAVYRMYQQALNVLRNTLNGGSV